MTFREARKENEATGVPVSIMVMANGLFEAGIWQVLLGAEPEMRKVALEEKPDYLVMVPESRLSTETRSSRRAGLRSVEFISWF